MEDESLIENISYHEMLEVVISTDNIDLSKSKLSHTFGQEEGKWVFRLKFDPRYAEFHFGPGG